MMTKLYLSPWVKDATASWWSSLANNPRETLYLLLLFLLPVQLGKHFWPAFSFIEGIRVDYLSPTIYFTDLIFLVFFAFSFRILLRMIAKKSWVIIGVVGMYLIFLAVFSASPLNSLFGIVRLAGYVYFAFATVYFLSQKQLLHSAITVFSLALFFVSLLTISQFILQHSVGGIAYFLGERTFSQQTPGIANIPLSGTLVLRPYATFPHPNVLGGYLVVGLTLLLFRGVITKQRITTQYGLFFKTTFFLGACALLLTLSRSAILAFISVVAIWFWQYRKKLPFRFLVTGGSIVFFVILAAGIFPRFLAFPLQDEAIVVRMVQFKDALSLWTLSPLFGVGYKNYLVMLPEVLSSFIGVRFLQPVHNTFLLILVETGVVGLVVFMWGLWKTVKHVLAQKTHLLPIGLLIILFLTGMFDHYWYTLHQGQLLWAFVIGLIWTTTRRLDGRP